MSLYTKYTKETKSFFFGGGNMVKTKCEVYSRVVGYIRPVSNWNDSKQAEFSDRSKFDSAVSECCSAKISRLA
jgi:hypothetical protein